MKQKNSELLFRRLYIFDVRVEASPERLPRVYSLCHSRQAAAKKQEKDDDLACWSQNYHGSPVLNKKKGTRTFLIITLQEVCTDVGKELTCDYVIIPQCSDIHLNVKQS